MNSMADEAFSNLIHLTVNTGNRLIGSSGNLAAAEFIRQAFTACGLQVSSQDFDCPDWDELSVSLELSGQTLPAFANTFSPSCDLSARTLAVGCPAELETAQISGRILIFYGDLAQHELAAKAAIYVPERDRRIVQLLEERSAAAVITINPSQNQRWRLVEDFDLAIPSVTVTALSGLKLVEHAGEVVHLKVQTRRAASHSSNIIGRCQGQRPERLVVCAHYDTKVDTPGAYDNAAGVAVMLSLASRLAAQAHAYTLEFVAFSGEEGYGLGDMTYAQAEELEAQAGSGGFASIQAALNFDGVGPRIASTTLASFEASEAMDKQVDTIRQAYPAVVRVEPWPASDHYIFYSHGVPSLAFSSVGIKDIYHTPTDSIEWISPEKLAEAGSLGLDILEALLQKEPGWTRRS